MRLGISGKGGVGKTTISAVLSRTLARRGHRVIAIDCDSDPNLGANVGLGESGAARLRPFLDQSGPDRRVPSGLSAVELLDQYGMPGPDGITILLGAMAEKAGSGCTGIAHVVVRGLIERIEDELPGVVVVADMEAGLEHLSWAGGTLSYVDMLLVVLQPSSKVMMTADRTHKLAHELGIGRVAFVGNRGTRPGDVERMIEFAGERDCELLISIPEDGAIPAADRAAHCVLDTAPECQAVRAIGRLADRLETELIGAI